MAYITQQPNGMKRVIVPVPHLVQATAGSLRQAIEQDFLAGDRITLDLTAVSFMDSTALGILVGGLKRIGVSGEFTVLISHPSVRALFELTRLDQVFTLHMRDTPSIERMAS